MPAHDVTTLLAELKRTDERAAADARAAVDWLTGGDGLEAITHLRVCEFLWYSLPLKWVCSQEDRLAVTRALCRLLELAGMERYAATCVSDRTADVLRTYETNGDEAGVAAYERALEASGLVPADTDELSWAAVRGLEEMRAYESCSAALEMSIACGEFTVGTTGWKTARKNIVDTWLTWQRPELGGQSWLERVHGERIDNWSMSRGQTRQELTRALGAQLAHEVPIPSGASQSLAPLRWLLEQAAAKSGLPLTERHYIAQAVVLEALDQFGWSRDLPTSPRTEVDVLPLHELRCLAQRQMRALRRTGRKLLLTPAGRRILADPKRLWAAATSALMAQGKDEPDFSVAVREVELMLLSDGTAIPRHELDTHVASVLGDEGWRDASGKAPDGNAVAAASTGLWCRLWALGLLAPHDDDTGVVRLGAVGQAAALAALRDYATRPRHHVELG